VVDLVLLEFQNREFMIDKIIEMYKSGVSSTEIAKLLRISKAKILETLHINNVEMRPKAASRKYGLNENSFSKITLESCYWAGFIAADGNIYNKYLSIELNNIDEKHLQKFRTF